MPGRLQGFQRAKAGLDLNWSEAGGRLFRGNIDGPGDSLWLPWVELIRCIVNLLDLKEPSLTLKLKMIAQKVVGNT